VQEVSRFQTMTPVPLASDVVRGLINLRGRIVTAIDLRTKLGLSDYSPEDKPMNIIVRDKEEIVNLLVDQIDDVVEVKQSIYEEAPALLTDKQKALITGVYKLDKELLLILDTQKAISVE